MLFRTVEWSLEVFLIHGNDYTLYLEQLSQPQENCFIGPKRNAIHMRTLWQLNERSKDHTQHFTGNDKKYKHIVIMVQQRNSNFKYISQNSFIYLMSDQ